MRPEPRDRLVCDPTVVDLVFGLAGHGILVDRAVKLTARNAVLSCPKKRGQCPFGLDDMHGVDFFGEAVIVVAGSEMQLADGGDFVSDLARPMMPGGHPSVIGESIVPIPGLMRIPASRDSGSGRATQRTGAVGVREPDPAPRNSVQCGRFDHGMAG